MNISFNICMYIKYVSNFYNLVKVAQDEVSKRVADRKREFEVKCKFYGLDPMSTQFKDFPFSVNPATGQWYTMDKRLISTPPSHVIY